MTTDRPHADPRRQGGWLPSEQEKLEQWLRGHRARSDDNANAWHPVITEFQHLIDTDPVVRMTWRR